MRFEDISKDLKIDVVRIPDRGGQHVYPDRTTTKVTHIPTGVTASVEMRSQSTAREIAIDMIVCAITHPKFR